MHGCAWVIEARSDGPLELRLMPDEKLQINPNFTLRVVQKRNDTLCQSTDIVYETFQVTLFPHGHNYSKV